MLNNSVNQFLKLQHKNGKLKFTPFCFSRYTRLSLSAQYREEVGRKAKQIFDYGRVKFLQDCGFRSRLVQYVTKDMTLENIALVAEA